VIYADGTNLDPTGAGFAGLFVYDSTGQWNW
jgi:hypothetical protein